MRCIIAGGRDVCDPAIFAAAIAACPFASEITVVLSGHCRKGIDPLGEAWAIARGLALETYPADWGRYGRSAGMKRNADMAAANAAALLAIPGAGPGTRGMIALARRRGLRTFVYDQHLAAE